MLTALMMTALSVLAMGCTGADTPSGSGPTIVVTTDILGDVVNNMVGDEATVEVVMPTGTSPHDFQPSASQVATMHSGDVLVTGGAGFETGLSDTIEAARADGVPVCEAIDGVETLTVEQGAEAVVDPHFFTDPARMIDAVEYLADCITQAVPELATAGFDQAVTEYSSQLSALDLELAETLAVVPPQRRALVTNHEVFGYFADRYDFEVLGAIIPSVSSQAQADAGSLSELASHIRTSGIPVVFADTASPRQLADALAREVGEVEVVTLFSETLGPGGGETYAEMMRTNAQRIADALQ
jgi:zinc/manganese transport system substrate-binding protein